jgi:hypothetical protein
MKKLFVFPVQRAAARRTPAGVIASSAVAVLLGAAALLA